MKGKIPSDKLAVWALIAIAAGVGYAAGKKAGAEDCTCKRFWLF